MFKEKLSVVPNAPGSYQMRDSKNNIIYVGKAKNLKNRLKSYFTGSHDYKTTKMIRQIHDFEYIVTNTELEAYILEIDLIKKYQPRYNILLMDDKTYPYIEITREKHPKMIVTRKVKKKHPYIFGPYPNVKAARETLKILNKLYPLRKCQTLPDEPCLYYHLGQCMAPCIKKIDPSKYRDIEKEISDFLKGKTTKVTQDLKQKMLKASDALEFEKAQEYKRMIEAIDTTTKSDQAVNLRDLKDRDIIGLAYDKSHVAVSILFIRNGKIAASEKKIMDYYLDYETTLFDYLGQFYKKTPLPSEILIHQDVNQAMLEEYLACDIVIPQKGLKRKVLDLANKNALDLLNQEKSSVEKEKEKTFGMLDDLAEMLSIDTPYHIEAFDNSHTFGEFPVSSMVVFKNARPSKNDYRKYRLKETPNQSGDTQQMEEVLYRRYRRVLMDDLKRPDLILVDGGIHQLNAAKNIIKTLELDIPIAGLVKNKTHKTNHLLDQDSNTFELDKNSEVFKFLSFVQEEAHRFAITFHKDLREKGVYESVLDNIPGVGVKTKKKLLRTFKTIEKIKNASNESLKALNINQKTIDALKKHLHEKK